MSLNYFKILLSFLKNIKAGKISSVLQLFATELIHVVHSEIAQGRFKKFQCIGQGDTREEYIISIIHKRQFGLP